MKYVAPSFSQCLRRPRSRIVTSPMRGRDAPETAGETPALHLCGVFSNRCGLTLQSSSTAYTVASRASLLRVDHLLQFLRVRVKNQRLHPVVVPLLEGFQVQFSETGGNRVRHRFAHRFGFE